METSAAKAASMKAARVYSAAEAGLPTSGIRTHHASMIEAAEGAGVDTGRHVVSDVVTVGADAAKTRMAVAGIGATESAVPRVAVLECGTAGNVRAMVKPYRMPVPIGVPVVPAPAKAREKPDADAYTEVHPGGVGNDARPTGVKHHRRTVDDPRVILRHVHDIGACRFDHDRLPVVRHGLLRGTLQIPRLLSSTTHHLNGSKNTL